MASERKINEKDLAKSVKAGKSNSQMAKEMGVTIRAVCKARKRWGLENKDETRRRQKAEDRRFAKIAFKEAGSITSDIMKLMQVVEGYVSDDILIEEYIKHQIEKVKSVKTVLPLLPVLYTAQDKVMDRIGALLKVQERFYDVNRVRGFFNGVLASYQKMPIEYRQILRYELSKSGFIGLELDQLVTTNVDPGRDANLSSGSEGEGIEIGAPNAVEQDGAVLEG